MGYNNNYAGMHLIYFNHYGKYEDLGYYDRLVAKETEKLIRINTKLPENKYGDLQMNKDESKKNSAISNKQVDQKQETINKSKQGKEKNKNKPRKVPSNSNREKERIIEDRHFNASFDVFLNIFTIAFEKRINMYPIIRNCEIMCQNDVRFSEQQRWEMYDSEKTFVFLSLMADQMGCEIYEFFALGEEGRKNKIRRALDYIIKKGRIEQADYLEIDLWFSCNDYTDEVDDKEIIISEIEISDFSYRDVLFDENEMPHNQMEYNLTRYCDKKTGEILEYDLRVGLSPISFIGEGNFQSQFMYTSGLIWKEKSGFLAESFELIYNKYMAAKESYLENRKKGLDSF